MPAAILASLTSLVAVGTGTPAQVPWYAPPTVAVETRHITFADGDATLSGTLYAPKVAYKVPAVVVLHGASEPLAGTPLYEHLREDLPRIGVAVLVFDRRGSGASSGKADVPYQTLADDGIAGARALRALPQIDSHRVGYWGISQGGWLATMATLRDPQAAFAVAVSAPLVTAETQMEFAMSNQLNVLGYSQADVADMMDARRELDGYFGGTNDRGAAVAALQRIENKPWFDLMYLPRASEVPKDPADSTWRKQMDVDFFAAVGRVNVPILFILGDRDPWIPVSATVRQLQTLRAMHPRLDYVVVPNANHLMMTPAAHEQMNDATPAAIATEKPDSTAYFMILGDWLSRTTRTASP